MAVTGGEIDGAADDVRPTVGAAGAAPGQTESRTIGSPRDKDAGTVVIEPDQTT